MPFSKPSPAAPIPLEIWLGDTDRAEVGREAFFRGRDHEYGVFQNALNMLMYGRVGGGIMIFRVLRVLARLHSCWNAWRLCVSIKRLIIPG